MDFTQIQEKRCSKCGATKPRLAFSRNTASKDGLRAQCKACSRAASAAYQQANPEKIAARKAARYAADPGKAAIQNAAWHRANRERASARRAAWDHANIARAEARRAAYRLANANNIVAYRTAYQKANKPADAAKTRARKARKLQAIPGWADKDAITTLYLKAREWSDILGTELEVDHTVPLKSPLVCGLHTPDNLQLLAASINQSKGNRHWPDMPGEA